MAKSGPPPASANKVLLAHSTFMCSHAIHGYAHATATEGRNCDTDWSPSLKHVLSTT